MIWSRLDTGEVSGQNSFVQLARRVHSITPSAAGAERVFSNMGMVHTKSRNRLKPTKVHKTVSVQADLRREERESVDDDDTARRPPKRKQAEVAAPILVNCRSPTSVRTGARTATPLSPVRNRNTTALRSPSQDSAPPAFSLHSGAVVGALAIPTLSSSSGTDAVTLGTASEPSEFACVVQELIEDSERDAETGPSTADARAAFEDAAAQLSSPDHDSGITDANALHLKNIFNFSSPYLSWAWPIGTRILKEDIREAERVLAEEQGEAEADE